MSQQIHTIMHPYQYSDFTGFFYCNGCGKGAYRASGKGGPEIPQPFPHAPNCAVNAQESGKTLTAA